MELDDIKRHALAARQFQEVHSLGTFTLTVPSKLQSSIAYAKAFEDCGQSKAAASLIFQRAHLVKAITAWSGVALAAVLPDSSTGESLDYEPGAVELLLDANPSLESALQAALMDRVTQHEKVLDTAEKN